MRGRVKQELAEEMEWMRYRRLPGMKLTTRTRLRWWNWWLMIDISVHQGVKRRMSTVKQTLSFPLLSVILLSCCLIWHDNDDDHDTVHIQHPPCPYTSAHLRRSSLEALKPSTNPSFHRQKRRTRTSKKEPKENPIFFSRYCRYCSVWSTRIGCCLVSGDLLNLIIVTRLNQPKAKPGLIIIISLPSLPREYGVC